LAKPFIGLHGELLVVKGEVLKEMEFSTNSLVEDLCFANESIEKV